MTTRTDPASPGRPGANGKARNTVTAVRKWVSGITGIVAILVIWQIVTAVLDVPFYILPQPTAIFEGIIEDRELLGESLWATLKVSGLGFLIGNALGIALAVVVQWSRTARGVVIPLGIGLQSVPIVALTPLIILIFGFGFRPTVATASIITFFPALINMDRGLSAVDADRLQLFRSLDASNWLTFQKLRWPSAVPYLFTALRITAPGAVLGAVAAEYIGANKGLGYQVLFSSQSFQYTVMWEATVIITVLVVLMYTVVGFVERRVVPWHQER